MIERFLFRYSLKDLQRYLHFSRKDKVVDNIDKTNSVEVVDGNKDIFENVFATYDRNYVKVPVLNAFNVNTR